MNHHFRSNLLQMGSSLPSSLDEVLNVNVQDYEGSCSSMYELRSNINSYLTQFANYTPHNMDVDISRLQTAKALVAQFLSSLNTGVPAFVQIGNKAQLQETANLMNKFKSLSMLKGDSIDDVRNQVSEFLNAKDLDAQFTEANNLLGSLDTMIGQVSAVKSQMFSVSEVNTLESKRSSLDAMIQVQCFNDVIPVDNQTTVDAIPDEFNNRAYHSYNEEPFDYIIEGENVTAVNLTEYVIGGWVRWLDFIETTFDDQGLPAVLLRLFSNNRKDLSDDKYLEDRHAFVTVTENSYSFCLHDTNENVLDNCYVFDISGLGRENTWHFVSLMYSYTTNRAEARIKIGNTWLEHRWDNIQQVSFQGYLGVLLGGDDFTDSRTFFNGEIAGWNVWYGTNNWISEPGTFDNSNAENILENYFASYVPVPVISKTVKANSDEKTINAHDFAQYNYVNSFYEASDYGFGVWLQLDISRAFTLQPEQILTFSFENRLDINTPGKAVGQFYIEDGSIMVEVAYESNGGVVSVAKEISPAYPEGWFFVQVQFSTSNGKSIQAWVQQSTQLYTVRWSDISGIFVPRNVFLNFGLSPLVNRTGADFKYKGVWVYAGQQTLYNQPCDSSCQSCNGPNPSDCISCADGFFLESGVCKACDPDCKTCGGCGDGSCTSCVDGKVLFNGKCVCDNSCLTCDGLTAKDCTSCKDHQVLVDGECDDCDDSCLECSASGSDACTKCNDGDKLVDGTCVPICDYSKCKECDKVGNCVECFSPKVVFNGDCVDCDPSCNTCSGPENYQCIDCVAPKQFYQGQCIECDVSCSTCNGPLSNNCLTCNGDNVLINGECLPPCDVDKGQVRVGDQCLDCDSSCLTCDGVGKDSCTSCDDTKVLSQGKCIPPTPAPCDTLNGYVMVGGECLFCDTKNGNVLINDGCYPCDKSCKNCNGVTEKDCTECNLPDVLSNGQCGPENPICQTITNCQNCSDNSICDVCLPGYTLAADGTCYLPPPPPPPCDTDNGNVLIDDICQSCDKSCQTCYDVNVNNCLTCADPTYVVNNGVCEPPCDTNNGFVKINDNCVPCDESCGTCFGPAEDNCDSCKDNTFNLVNGECLPPCDVTEPFVLKNKQCLPCHESCKTCSDISNNDCTDCYPPNVLQNGACVPAVCPDGQVWVSGQCVDCDESCLTCDGVSNTDCLTCKDGLIMSSGSCIVPNPVCLTNAGQVLINGQCFDCDKTCETCSDVSEKDCIICAPGLEFQNDLCVVPCVLENGFYLENGACEPCDVTCKTCTAGGPSDCTDCKDGYFFEFGTCKPLNCVDENYFFTESDTHDCSSDCDCDGTRRCSPYNECHDCNYIDATFPNLYNTTVCPPCDTSCKDCRGYKNTDCTSCLEHQFLSKDGECLPCDSTCYECDGTGPSDCTKCDGSDVFVNGVCNVPCDVENGMFLQDSRNCLPCDDKCNVCHGVLPTDCDVCKDGYDLTDGSCKVPCSTDKGQYYDENGNCQNCDDSCLTCDGPTDSNCTDCDTDYFLEFGKCLPTRCDGYDYVFDENLIKSCNSDCECDGTRRCDPTGQCEDCNTLYQLYPNLYGNALCPPCDQSCGTCRGPNTEDCTDCKDGFYWSNGYCLPCDSTCSKCIGGDKTQCIECDPKFEMVDGLCVPPCDVDAGQYRDKDLNCHDCDKTCQTCDDETQCTSCFGEDVLDKGTCLPPCNLGTFVYDDNNNCVPCDKVCNTCFAVGPYGCSSCDDDEILVNNTCQGCVSFFYQHDENENANGPSQCTSDCNCDNTRRCNPDGVCQDCLSLADQYPYLYFSDACPICDPSCLTCNGPNSNNCITCVDGFYLGTDDSCYPCDSSCLRCNGGSDKDCTECANKDDNLVDGECLPPNPICHPTCLTCDGTTDKDCLTCADDKELVDRQCQNKNCISWDYSYNELTSPLGAHVCDDDCECDGTRRCSPDAQCLECLDLVSMFPDQYDLKDCPPCDDTCKTCSGPSNTDCTSCETGFFLDKDGTCEPCDKSCATCDGPADTDCQTCPIGYVLGDKGDCVVPCDPSCDTCDGPSDTDCITCPPTSYLSGGKCIDVPVCVKLDFHHDESTNALGPNKCYNDCDCDSSRRCGPDGVCRECMYLAVLYPTQYLKETCPPCDDSCHSCQGPSAQDCTSCDSDKVLIGGVCEPCDYTCLTCNDVNSNNCLSCDEDHILSDGSCIKPPPSCKSDCLTCDPDNRDNCVTCPDGQILTNTFRCIPQDCESWDYNGHESDDHRCQTDCDCDGSRRCSPDFYCQECNDLATQWPEIYTDCPICDKSCANCNGPNDDNCISCDNGFVLVNGYCQPCDSTCATCSGTTKYDCLSCFKDYDLDKDGECLPPIPPCDESCKECSGPANTECTVCFDGFALAANGSCQPDVCNKWDYTYDESSNPLGSGRCSDNCQCDGTRKCSPTGYCRECSDLVNEFPDIYPADDCPVCDPTCLTCSGPTAADCITCADGSLLIGNSCVPCDCDICPNYYPLNCQVCAINYSYDKDLDKCIPVCDVGYQNDKDTGDCVPICAAGTVFGSATGLCYPVCADGFVYNNLTDNCDSICDYGYEYDVNQGTCVSLCSDLYIFVNGECVHVCYDGSAPDKDGNCPSPCPDGYELDKDDNCVPVNPICDSSCANCSGTTAYDCTNCYSGFKLMDDGSCEKCDCTICPDMCVCDKGYIWSNDLEECVEVCDDGVTPVDKDGSCPCPENQVRDASGQCVPVNPICDSSCATCSGPSNTECNTCFTDFYLTDVNSCAPCDCVNCPDMDSCKSCPDGFIFDSGRCLFDCGNGIVADKDGVCPCFDTNCASCSGSTEKDCTVCVSGYVLAPDNSCEKCDCNSCPDMCVCDKGYVWSNDVNSCVEVCEDGVTPVDKDGNCPSCIAFDYHFVESTDGTCDNDCQCDNSRRCSADHRCGECFDLVYEFPTTFAYSDCPVCEQPCLSCSGPTDKDCTSCKDGDILVDGSCVPCDSTCATCKDSSANGCVSCPPGFDLQADGSCKPHYDCFWTCKTCNGPNEDQCTDCVEERELESGKCPLKCVQFDYQFEENNDGSCTSDCDCDGTRRCAPTGYCADCSGLETLYSALFNPYDCPPCDKSCATCYGPDADNCKSCDDGYYLASDGTCEPCDGSCETCDGPENTDCTKCTAPKQLVDGSCTIPNPVCDPSCATCYGPAADNCITCYDFFELSKDDTCEPIQCNDWSYSFNELLTPSGPHTCDTDCECSGTRRCNNGQCYDCLDLVAKYPTVYDDSWCEPCDITCLRCNGPTDSDCTVCADGFYLFDDGHCYPCDKSCETCSSGNDDNCLTCPDGTVLSSSNTCVPPSPICDPTCTTCTGSSNQDCISCTLPRLLVDGECRDDCDSLDYFHDESTNKNGPNQCSNKCECSGSRQCASNGYCYECLYAAENFPEEFDSKDCPPCDNSCLTCDGPNANNCKSCVDGFYLDGSSCQECDKSCKTCVGGDIDQCTDCYDPQVILAGHCVDPNPVCDKTCATCKGTLPTDCVTCYDYSVLSEDGTCDPMDCIDFFYVHNENLNQQGPGACDSDCECSGTRRCNINTHYCDECLALVELSPSTYPLSECPPCDASCANCDGPTDRNCTECKDSNLFNGQCIVCDKDCLTCFGTESDNCLSCEEPKVLYEAQCVTPDPTCDTTCLTCTGPSATECVACPCDRTYLEGECILKVINCDESCATCYGEAKDQCRTCAAGRILLGGECVQVTSLVGYRSFDEAPVNYDLTKKIGDKSDLGIGSYTRFLTYVPKKVEGTEEKPYNVLFRLSGLSNADKNIGTNDFRFSSLAVYYNFTHYTFETYSKSSGSPVLIQKYVPINEFQLENSWNLVFFGYSRINNRASGFVVFPDGSKQTVEFSNIVQDKPEDNMEVFFYGDNVYNGFNGEISSPEVLHGNNFLQNFDASHRDTYFKFEGSNGKNPVSLISVDSEVTLKSHSSNKLYQLGDKFSDRSQYSVGGWFKYKRFYSTEQPLSLFSLYFSQDETDNVVQASIEPTSGQIMLNLESVFNTSSVTFDCKCNSLENQWVFAYVSYDAKKKSATFAAKIHDNEFYQTIPHISSFIPGSDVNVVVGEDDGENSVGNVYMESGKNYENIKDILKDYTLNETN